MTMQRSLLATTLLVASLGFCTQSLARETGETPHREDRRTDRHEDRHEDRREVRREGRQANDRSTMHGHDHGPSHDTGDDRGSRHDGPNHDDRGHD